MEMTHRQKLMRALCVICAVIPTIYVFHAKVKEHDRWVAERAAIYELIRSFGVVIADEHGVVTSWSEALAEPENLGWTADDMVGKSITDIIPKEMRPVHQLALDTAVAERRAAGNNDKVKTQRVKCNALRKGTDKLRAVQVSVRVLNTYEGIKIFAIIENTRDVEEVNVERTSAWVEP